MMRVRMLDLASAVKERDGLVHVIEGGFNVVGAREYPTTLDLELVASVEVDIDDEVDEYQLDISIELTCEDGLPVDVGRYRRQGTLRREGTDSSGLGSVVLPFATETSELRLPRPGIYRFTLFDREVPVAYIRFAAEQISDAAEG